MNQSGVKDLESPSVCPKKRKAYDIDKLFRRESTPMLYGQYFEYCAFGTPAQDGSIPSIPPNSRTGKPVVAQLRIEQQARRLKQWMRDEGYYMTSKDILLEWNTSFHDLGDVVLHGVLDVMLRQGGRKVITDLKCVGDINSTFGPFCWGDMERYDKLQASFYIILLDQIFGVKADFMYYIADYKKNPEFKTYPVRFEDVDYHDTMNRFELALKRQIEFEKQGWPAWPSEGACKNCQVDCAVKGQYNKNTYEQTDENTPTELEIIEQLNSYLI